MKTSTAFFVSCIEREKAKENLSFSPGSRGNRKTFSWKPVTASVGPYIVQISVLDSETFFNSLELEIHQMGLMVKGPLYKRFELNHQIIIVGSL